VICRTGWRKSIREPGVLINPGASISTCRTPVIFIMWRSS